MKFSGFLIPIFLSLLLCSQQIFAIADLSQVPKKEMDRIENFLSYLILDEGFAYVLFGSKPMSIIGYDKTTPISYKELYSSPLFELESWWKTWEKYQYLFPMEEYLFFVQNKETWFEIILINKVNFIKIIETHLTLFQEKIGQTLSTNEIFNHIVSSDDFFTVGLNKSQTLFGLLLGYGKDNAEGFEKYFSKEKKTAPPPLASMQVDNLHGLMLPCFVSFSNQETKGIIKKYHRERQKIMDIYSKGSFLEITLKKLTATPAKS